MSTSNEILIDNTESFLHHYWSHISFTTNGSESEQENSHKYIKNLNDDYTCHDQILSALSDPLYDLNCDTNNSKDLWDALEKKYDKENAGEEKYTVGEYWFQNGGWKTCAWTNPSNPESSY